MCVYHSPVACLVCYGLVGYTGETPRVGVCRRVMMFELGRVEQREILLFFAATTTAGQENPPPNTTNGLPYL